MLGGLDVAEIDALLSTMQKIRKNLTGNQEE